LEGAYNGERCLGVRKGYTYAVSGCFLGPFTVKE
jgi:hypothetical protein